MRYDSNDLANMSDSVRALALHSILRAKSGHIGIVLDAAEIVTCIFANFLRRGTDRFVLSAGHGSAMLYAVLKLSGHNITSLDNFRKIGGLPGHPEYGIDGIDATTGPLGQGIGNSVGLALAGKIKKDTSRVFCLCSDGDLSEGIAQEAIAFAGRYNLNNLVLLWDDNGITIDGTAQTDIDIPMRIKSAGWEVFENVNGADCNQINQTISKALKSTKPSFIQCKNTIGRGSKLENKASAHGLALTENELLNLIQKFISVRGDALWAKVASNNIQCIENQTKINIPNIDNINKLSNSEFVSTRELSGIYLNELLKNNQSIIGGSADLGTNTGAFVKNSIKINTKNFNGNYINYGIREHAMAAIMNGLAVAGQKPYGSTFLVFSDYMRPAIRLSAMSKLPVIYIFSHDSIAVGPDGPTHQPIEQLPSLRLIPNLNVFRPCNLTEIIWAWNRAITERTRPTCIILSRQKFKQIPSQNVSDINKGAYIITPAKSKKISLTLISTGSEIPLAFEIAKKIGPNVQIVSMLDINAFREQNIQYKQKILRGFVVVIEASASAPWFEFANAVIGIDKFGISGDGDEVYKNLGFDIDSIVDDIINKIN